MKIIKKNRKFKVGKPKIIINHVADVILKNDELVNFKFGKSNYDFVKKNWGFYLSGSINRRLKKEGFKIIIVKNKTSQIYLMAVHKHKMDKFIKYCKDHKQKIIKRLTNKI